MRGKLVSEKEKINKIVGVKTLVGNGSTVAEACIEMDIKLRTYYDYKKQLEIEGTLKDKRGTGLDDLQKCWLELYIKMYEDLTVEQYKDLINEANLINSYVFGVESLEISKDIVWRYLVNRLGVDGKIEMMGSYEDRVKNITKVYGDLAGSFFIDGAGWENVRNLFAPNNYKLRKIESGRKDK